MSPAKSPPDPASSRLPSPMPTTIILSDPRSWPDRIWLFYPSFLDFGSCIGACSCMSRASWVYQSSSNHYLIPCSSFLRIRAAHSRGWTLSLLVSRPSYSYIKPELVLPFLLLALCFVCCDAACLPPNLTVLSNMSPSTPATKRACDACHRRKVSHVTCFPMVPY